MTAWRNFLLKNNCKARKDNNEVDLLKNLCAFARETFYVRTYPG